MPDASAITRPVVRRTLLNYAQPVDPNNFYGTSSDFDAIASDITVRNVTRFGKTTQDYMLTSFTLGGLTAGTRTAAGVPGVVPTAATAAFLATLNAANPLTWTMTRNQPTNKDQQGPGQQDIPESDQRQRQVRHGFDQSHDERGCRTDQPRAGGPRLFRPRRDLQRPGF